MANRNKDLDEELEGGSRGRGPPLNDLLKAQTPQV